MAIDNVGIVLCGDFNIKSDSAEYQSDLVSLGGRNRVLRDLYLHPAAVNDITSDRGGEQCTFDPVGNSMAVEHEAAGRIDYIFTVDELMLNIRSTKTPEASVSLRFLPVKASNLTIHAADIQASDHYPITVDIELF
jgi:endonuclease/exonuclease/phosphatase family metal-dependent hydrolase